MAARPISDRCWSWLAQDIAERYLELDAYLRALLSQQSTCRAAALLDFLGIAKQSVRYGVRNFECAHHGPLQRAACLAVSRVPRRPCEATSPPPAAPGRYDSSQSEGNRYIRDSDL